MVADELGKIAGWVAFTNSQQSPGRNTEKKLLEHFDWGRSKSSCVVSKISACWEDGKGFQVSYMELQQWGCLRVVKMVRWEQSSRAGTMQALFSLLSAELSARCLGCLSVLFRTVITAIGRGRQDDKFKVILAAQLVQGQPEL